METFKSQRKLVCLNVRKNKKHVKNELKKGFKRKESVEMNTHWNRIF